MCQKSAPKKKAAVVLLLFLETKNIRMSTLKSTMPICRLHELGTRLGHAPGSGKGSRWVHGQGGAQKLRSADRARDVPLLKTGLSVFGSPA